MSNLKAWPKAPEAGKALYVDDDLPADLQADLAGLGWQLIDVRLMPNDSDGARADAWKAYMEGVRVGSITPDKTKLKFLELEGRALGLLGTKGAPKDKPKVQLRKDEIDQLLSMSSDFAFRGGKP